MCALIACLGFGALPPAGAGPEDATGPVGLAELVALALANDPRLIAARGEITIAEARKRVERQWPDPQLRFSTSWRYNDVPDPYRETRHESVRQKTHRQFINEDGDLETSTSTETVDQLTRRTITPGRDRTVIEEHRREISREGTVIDADPSVFLPERTESDNRTSFRDSTETRYHQSDPFASEQDVSVMLRVFLPHPGMRRARLAKAQHRIDRAQSRVLALEHQVVMEVRELYQELQYLQARTGIASRSNDAATTFLAVQDRMIEDGDLVIDDIDFVPVDDLAVEAASLEFESKRSALAARVGLEQPERIRVSDRLVAPGVDIRHTDLEYLIRMAFTTRGELAEIRGSGRMAEADLREVKAKHIPWFDYVQVGTGRGEQGGTRTDTEWGVSLAMGLPVFTWFGHEEELHEAEIASYYSQMDATKKIITAEVVAAYQNIKRAAAFRGRARGNSIKWGDRKEEFLARVREDMNPHKLARTTYRIDETIGDADRHRLDAERAYNVALLQLERALGAPLDQVFDHGTEAAARPAELQASAAPVANPAAPAPTAAEGADAGPTPDSRPGPAAEASPRRSRIFGRFRLGRSGNGSGFSNGRPHK